MSILASGQRVKFLRLPIFLTFLVMTLSGCLPSVSDGPKRTFSVADETEKLRSYISDAEKNYYSVSGNALARNEIIFARMRAIDINYYAYEADLMHERQGIGFGAIVASIGLSGAASVLTPVQTKTILSVINGALLGTTKAYSEEVLFKKTIEFLQGQMRANRLGVAAKIISQMNDSIDKYSLQMALADVEEYYVAGTLAGALIAIGKTIGETTGEAEDAKAAAVLSLKYSSDDLTKLLENYISPGGKLVASRTTEVRKLLDSYSDKRSINAVLYNASAADVRRRLARDLKLIP